MKRAYQQLSKSEDWCERNKDGYDCLCERDLWVKRASPPPTVDGEHTAGGTDPYRELFERSADAILIIEGEHFVDCNDATIQMLRYESKAQVLRAHPSQLSPPTQPEGRDSYEKANELMSIAFEQGSHRFEWLHQRADGEIFPVEVLLTAVRESDRRVLHVVWRDITERKQLEEQLRHAQKMEAIGKLAGGIAHDFNNLLVAIVGHSDLLELSVNDNARAQEHLDHIREAADRAASLVSQLLAFGRRQRRQPASIDLDALVNDLEGLLDGLVGDEIEIFFRRSPTPLPVLADRSQLEQVLFNLAANARDAMAEGGTLTIATGLVERPPPTAHGISSPSGEQSWCTLAVTDTGAGMDDETLRRAFDPFFTTKALGKGTGLGLSTAYGIIIQSGGLIDLDSSPGRGTRVTVYLPQTDVALSPPTPSPQALPLGGGSETILVAEDDEAVASVILEVLREEGYEVLLARDGREAVTLYEEHQQEIDLVLSDVVMPRLDGPDMISELRRRGFNPRVLFASGYTDNALIKLKELDDEVALIKKPFTARQLAGHVRLSLDRS